MRESKKSWRTRKEADFENKKSRQDSLAVSSRLPDAVEDVSIGKDANVDIGYDDVMKMSFSLVGEEESGHPDFVWICQCQVLQFTCNIETVGYTRIIEEGRV